MDSSLQLEKHAVIERLGFVRLTFELHERDAMVVMHLVRLHILGVPCPARRGSCRVSSPKKEGSGTG